MARTQQNWILNLCCIGMFTLAAFALGPIILKNLKGELAPVVQAQPTAAVRQPPATPVVIYQPAPVVYTQQEQAPPQIAIQQPPAPPTAEPEAPVQVQPQPAMIVVHERESGAVVTGSGACAVGGNVARRCGK